MIIRAELELRWKRLVSLQKEAYRKQDFATANRLVILIRDTEERIKALDAKKIQA